MSSADFIDLRDRCKEAWALAELGRVELEPIKDRYAKIAFGLGISTIVLGIFNSAEASDLITSIFRNSSETVSGTAEHSDFNFVGLMLGLLTIAVGSIISFIDPGAKSAEKKEAWMLLGTKQSELTNLVDEVRQRTVRGTDHGTRRKILHEINKSLDNNDIAGSGRHANAQRYEADCLFHDWEWRGTYVGDDLPTSEEADPTMTPIDEGI
ncbi:MAG: hypothetical protein AAFQ19_12045 [Pseudomonadota bacterium]